MRNNIMKWDIKQAIEPNALDIYIYGDVEGDGYDWRTDETIESETSANHFREVLAKYPNASQINLYINSYGGSVFEGTAIYNQLKRHPAHITAHIDGFACSVASVIAMAGDEVIMPRNAMMMIHNAWMWAAGNSAELRKAADDLEQINRGSRQAYLQKAGDKLSEDKLIELLDAETWLTAEDCIMYGLADEYAEQDADMSKAEEVLQKANLTVLQRIKFHENLVAQVRHLTQNVTPLDPKADAGESESQEAEGQEGQNPESHEDAEPEEQEPKNIPKNLMAALFRQ